MQVLATSAIEMRAVVLIVEDDAGDALLAQEYLAEESDGQVTTVWVRSLAEALRAVGPTTSCVLLDLGLPDVQGLAALHAITQAAPSVPVVVLTGLGERSVGVAALAAGAEDYLVKDEVTGSSLVRSVRYAIERRHNDDKERRLLEAELRREENGRLARGLLPTPRLQDPRLRWASRYTPAADGALLGGDFVDAVELPDGRVRAVVGDVCGHGPEEAALGACLRIGWRTMVLGDHPADAVLPTLEALFEAERHDPALFTSVCDLEVSADRRRVTVRSAGHVPPVCVGDGGARMLDVATGPLLGLGLPAGPATTLELPAAWQLLLFTDGVFEGRTAAGTGRLGLEAFVAMVAEAAEQPLAGPELLDELLRRAEEHHGGPLPDDVAMFVLGHP